MNKLLAVLALLTLGSAHAATLATRSYTIEITPLCGEAVTDCEQFAYAGTHNRTGSRINMTGKPGMRSCPPGCDPTGYQFYDRNVSYFVGRDGWLIVHDGRKTVLRELGTWRN